MSYNQILAHCVTAQVIPITDSMREPRKFPVVLSGVMLVLLVIFGGAGILSYLAFGSDIQTVVLVNLDTKSKLTQAVCTHYMPCDITK